MSQDSGSGVGGESSGFVDGILRDIQQSEFDFDERAFETQYLDDTVDYLYVGSNDTQHTPSHSDDTEILSQVIDDCLPVKCDDQSNVTPTDSPQQAQHIPSLIEIDSDSEEEEGHAPVNHEEEYSMEWGDDFPSASQIPSDSQLIRDASTTRMDTDDDDDDFPDFDFELPSEAEMLGAGVGKDTSDDDRSEVDATVSESLVDPEEAQPSTSNNPNAQAPFVQPMEAGEDPQVSDEEENMEQGDNAFDVQRERENNLLLEVVTSRSFKSREVAEEITYRIRPRDLHSGETLSSLSEDLYSVFETVLEDARQRYGSNAMMRIFIKHPKLEGAMILKPNYINNFSAVLIMDEIERRMKSAGEIPIDGDLILNIAVCRFVKGMGRTKILREASLKRKRSVVVIYNSDKLCLARAIVVGRARCLVENSEEGSSENVEAKKRYKVLCDKRRDLQEKEARELLQATNLPSDEEGSLDHVPLFEQHIEMNIVVVSVTGSNKPIYNGCRRYNTTMYLYHTLGEKGEGHFDVIGSMNAFLGKKFYCNECCKGFDKKEKHDCSHHCRICGRSKCERVEEQVCADCNRTCRSTDCLQAHKRVPKRKGKTSAAAAAATEVDSVQLADRSSNEAGEKCKSLCQRFWQCPHCSVLMKRTLSNDHMCGETMCTNCQKFYTGNYHQCFVRQEDPESKLNKFLFYDFEATQDDGTHKPNLVVVQSVCNLCEDEEKVSDTSKCKGCGSRCDLCGKKDKEGNFECNPCQVCGFRQKIFQGEHTVKEFGDWLIHPSNAQSVVIAHNAKAYDAYFIFDYLISIGKVPQPIIFSGSKIMYLRVQDQLGITFLDSINFLPMPLAKLPKAFGLKELKKGYFPHLFNTEDNQAARLPQHPDAKYYSPDTMGVEAREAFYQWYEANKYKPFDLQVEMLQYCISDVDILRRACCEFRNLVRSATGVKKSRVSEDGSAVDLHWEGGAIDPFSCMTIASVCMKIFRTKFITETWQVLLKENAKPGCDHGRYRCQCHWNEASRKQYMGSMEIRIGTDWVPQKYVKERILKERFHSTPVALLPNTSLLAHDVCSKEALQWLQKEQAIRGYNIQTARSENGEVQVLFTKGRRLYRYKLDGYACVNGQRIAFEYNGCSFHGCRTCFPSKRDSTKVGGKSLEVRRKETQFKEELLRANGYEVVSMWQCEFKKCDLTPVEPLINMKECYFGGRTNALRLYKTMEEGEKGYYIDFTSLYPAVLKYKRYPVGHPVRITDKFDTIRKVSECNSDCQCIGEHLVFPYFGMAKVTVLPPTNLFIPVLPLRANGKLKFPLCHKCAVQECKGKCTCSDSERQFTQTYCTPEIEVALNCGYKLIAIHEVLHFPKTEVFSAETNTGGLFTEYINSFLKMKQEASDYPQHVHSDEEKDTYIRNYLQHEGISLERDRIKKNPGLRSLAKLILNSFYGKFGQRTNMGTCEFVNEAGALYNILLDHSKEVTDWHIMSENVMMIKYLTSDGFDVESVAGNVAIAAFCTTWARLKLFRTMKKLGERVIYHDTDSIIYTAKEGDFKPPLGEYLGEFTDELSCKEVGCKTSNCEGHWIVEFVSCGPKNYAFRLNSGEVTCKVRGFSLNYHNSRILNFDTMKKALFSWHRGEPEQFETVSTMILRSKEERKVYNRVVKKRYSVVYDKRQVLSDLSTRPYGFRD